MNQTLKEYFFLIGQIENLYHDIAVKMGLSDSELDILYSIAMHGSGCNQSLFYKETGATKSTINSSIRKMETAGYLYLKPGTGRNTLVFLTEKGENLMKSTVFRLIAKESAILNSWSPGELETYLRLTKDFIRQLSKAANDL